MVTDDDAAAFPAGDLDVVRVSGNTTTAKTQWATWKAEGRNDVCEAIERVVSMRDGQKARDEMVRGGLAMTLGTFRSLVDLSYGERAYLVRLLDADEQPLLADYASVGDRLRYEPLAGGAHLDVATCKVLR